MASPQPCSKVLDPLVDVESDAGDKVVIGFPGLLVAEGRSAKQVRAKDVEASRLVSPALPQDKLVHPIDLMRRLMVLGNMSASEAIHKGKLTQ